MSEHRRNERGLAAVAKAPSLTHSHSSINIMVTFSPGALSRAARAYFGG